MHILFLINDYPPGGLIGGIVTYTRLIARAWHEAGHQVSIVCQSRDRERHEENQEGVRVVRVPTQNYPFEWLDQIKFRLYGDNSLRLIFHKELSWAFYQEVKTWKNQPDVIESPDAFGWSWAILKHLNIPVMIRAHGPNELASRVDPDNKHLKAQSINDQEKWCLRHAQGVFPPTQYLSDFLHSLGINTNQITQLPLKYPFEFPQIPQVQRYKDPTIVTVGRLIPGKGFDTAIHALAKLDSHWRLLIIGPDDKFGPRQESYQQHLKDLAQSLHVSDRVNFLGQLDKQSVYEEMSKSHVFMLDSKNDNMPFVILEALALNVPAVASRIGGIPETLEEHGHLVDVGDVSGYVRAIESIDLSQNLHTREFVMQRHDPVSIQKKIEEAYKGVLGL